MADSVIKVGMDVGDVKTAGLELVKRLQEQVDATLELAEAQVKYNKEGKQVGSVLKGLTEAGERYTVVVKQTATAYELVNAQVTKAKSSFNDMAKAQRDAAEAAKMEAKAVEDAERARAKLNARLEVAGRRGLMSQESERLSDLSSGPLRSDGGRGTGGPPTGGGGGGFFDSLFGGADKAQKSSERLFITWQGIVRLIEAQVIKRAISEIAGQLSEAVSNASKFSIAIAEIQTISQDMPIGVEKWRTELTKLSGAFGQSQADVAGAAYETLSNQVAKGPKVFDFLATAMKFGAATVTSTTDSVNLLSSALKSFEIPVEQAESVASIFFKTIDLGRVRAKEMADTFGRIGAIANQSGVKLEEVAAAISTITIRGVKFSDASTIITNVLSKLIKPTDAMKELFQEWGVATGEAAIQTFGFEGVLAKLNEESKKGSSRIGELFNQIRAMRGAFQLSGQGFADYQENLRKITGAQQEYNKAANIVLESPGKQLQIAGQKIKNLFTEDFGKNAVQTLVDFNKWLETSTGSADGLERAVKLIIKGMTALAVTLVTVKVLTISNIASTTTWAEAFSMLSVSAQNAGIQILKALPLLAAFAAGYAAGEVLFNPENTGGQSKDSILAAVRAKQETEIAAAKKYKEVNGDNDLDITKDVKKALDARYQFALSYTTNVVRLSEEIKKRSIDDYKDITDAVKISSRSYFDSITGRITDLRKEVSEADALIKGSLKSSEDLGRRGDREVFDSRLKHAGQGYIPFGANQVMFDQKIPLLQNRLESLLAEARGRAGEGTKEAFEESRKLYNDAEKIQQQLFEAKTGIERRNFDERVRQGIELPSNFDSQGKPVYTFTVETVKLERELGELTAERLKSEREFRQLQRERAESAEKEIAREKERLRSLQQAFSAIEKIDIFTKEGKVKDEFKKDPGLVTRQFDEQADKIRALAGNEKFGDQFKVFSDLQRQKAALVREVQASIRAEEAATGQQGIVRAKEQSQKLVDQAGSAIENGKNAVTEGLNKLEQDLAVIEGRSLRLQSVFKIPFTNQEVFVKDDAFKRSEPKRQEALALLEEVRAASKAFSDDRSPEKMQLLKEKLDALKTSTAEYLQLRTGQSPENLKDAGDNRTQLDRIRGLDTGVSVAEGGVAKTNQGKGQLMEALDQASQLDVKLKGLPGAAQFFAEKLQEQAPIVNDTLESFSASALKLTNQMQALNEQLSLAAKLTPQVRGNRDGVVVPEGNRFGGPPKMKYMAFGGPVGTDRVPAMLGEDEYVMTGAATKQFAPLLKAMNSYPSRAGGSGNSITNVGDINVSVNGGDTSAQTVREIGVGLRRAIARGTVKLHG